MSRAVGSETPIPSPGPSLLVRAADIAWRFLVIAAGTGVLAIAVMKLRVVVFPLLLAVLASTLLTPPVAWLRSRGIPSWAATWAVFVVVGSVSIGTGFLLAPQASDQFQRLAESVRNGSEEILTWTDEGRFGMTDEEASDLVASVSDELSNRSGVILAGAWSGAIRALELVTGALLSIVLTFYFVKDGNRIFEWFLSLTPERHREDVRGAALTAWGTLSSYLRGTMTIAAIDAFLVAILLLVVGSPVVAPMVLLTFFAAFFPIVGATLAGTVVAVATLVNLGSTQALVVAAGIIVIQQVEGNLLQPLIQSHAVRLHPVVILVALAAGAVLGGIAGAFLSVPLTAVAVSVGTFIRGRLADTESREDDGIIVREARDETEEATLP